MDHFIDSLSNSLSKEFGAERSTISDAYFGDLKKRPPGSISTERIDKKVPLLGTYVVKSDAIPGGMGSVWKVLHTGWNTDLAMKRPHPVFFAEAGDETKANFITECEYWINLGLHPNIVSCYYVREIGGVPTIFSEWMDGGSLKDRIEDKTLYNGTDEEVRERILDIAIQAARGLQYSHERGLIHQDMKPGNLLLTNEWEAKVADFGLAKATAKLGKEASEKRYRSLAYCPKEQDEGEIPAPWMDVYAWAVSVLEMYVGGHPWNIGANVKPDFEKYAENCRIAMPDGLRQLLHKCVTDTPSGFNEICDSLEDIYRSAIGKRYPRPRFNDPSVSADNLNNYAISMIDLGFSGVARKTWEYAIREYGEHDLSAVNRAFFRWRSAEINDREVFVLLDALPDSEEKQAALEQLDIERGIKKRTENGVENADVEIMHDLIINGAVFESDEIIWVITHKKLMRIDLKTKEITDELNCPVTDGRLYLLSITPDKRHLYFGTVNALFVLDLWERGEPKPVTLASKEELLPLFNIPKEQLYSDGFGMDHVCFGNDSSEMFIRCSIMTKDPAFSTMDNFFDIEYRLDSPTGAALIGVENTSRFSDPKPVVRSDKPKAWKINNGLVYAENSRVVRSDLGSVILSENQRQFLNINRSHGKEYLWLCRIPDIEKYQNQYMLSRIKNISKIIEEDSRAKELYDAFKNAVKNKDFTCAIKHYNEYRDLPDREDSEECIKMELALDGNCRRDGIHRFGKPAKDIGGFDMTPAEQSDWVKYVYCCESPEEKLYGKKAEDIVKSKLPFTYKNDSRETKTMKGDCYVNLLSSDMRYAYVGIYPSNETDTESRLMHCGTVKVDLKTRKITAASEVIGQCLTLSPDKQKLAMIVRDGKNTFQILEGGSVRGYFFPGIYASYMDFSPDKEYLLLNSTGGKRRNDKLYGSLRYSVIRACPPRELKPGEERLTELPPMLFDGKDLVLEFSSDGLHLLGRNVRAMDKGTTPWVRICYNYKPKPQSPKTQSKDPKSNKKGFFSSLFKKSKNRY